MCVINHLQQHKILAFWLKEFFAHHIFLRLLQGVQESFFAKCTYPKILQNITKLISTLLLYRSLFGILYCWVNLYYLHLVQLISFLLWWIVVVANVSIMSYHSVCWASAMRNSARRSTS